MPTLRSEIILAAFKTAVVDVVAAAESATAYRMPVHEIAEDALPALIQLDGGERIVALDTLVDTYEIDVDVAVVTLRPASGNIGTTYREMAGALIGAALADITLGGVSGVENTTFEGLDAPDIEAADGSTAYAAGLARFKIIFSTAQNDPFSAP